jgi:amino acid transporter
MWLLRRALADYRCLSACSYSVSTFLQWDSAASFAGEVEDPGRSFPLAMAMCVVLVIFSNVLPVLVGTGVEKNPDYSQWEDGYFAVAAQKIAGPWLGVWVVAAAAVSNVGLFEAEMR